MELWKDSMTRSGLALRRQPRLRRRPVPLHSEVVSRARFTHPTNETPAGLFGFAGVLPSGLQTEWRLQGLIQFRQLIGQRNSAFRPSKPTPSNLNLPTVAVGRYLQL